MEFCGQGATVPMFFAEKQVKSAPATSFCEWIGEVGRRPEGVSDGGCIFRQKNKMTG